MSADVQGVDQKRCWENLCGGGLGGIAVRVRDVGHETAHWKIFGRITPQGGPQADGTTTSEKAGRWMVVYPGGRSYERSRITRGGDLSLLPP